MIHFKAIHQFALQTGALVALLLVAGCINNVAQLGSGSTMDNGLASGDPNNGQGPSDGSNIMLALSRVISSPLSPTTNLDLFGDGSDSIGNNCVGLTANDNSIGASTCACNFEYSKPGSTNVEKWDAVTVYRESNMIRCPYTGIPSGVGKVTVRIHVVGTSAAGMDGWSNPIIFDFAATGLIVDTSLPDSFSKVLRYQCRDSVTLPGLLDSNLYDPFLSDDPHLAYPQNFYSTNLGGSLSAFIINDSAKPKLSGQAQYGFECPALPIDTNDGINDGRTDQAGNTTNYDLRIWSHGAAGGSKSIYPISGADRHTFYVANTAAGIFNTPVNALVAPVTFTDNDPGTPAPPPLGFATPAIATGGDTETCPDSNTVIPPGFKWAKLWLFRGQLAAREVPTSTKIPSLSYIACNPTTDNGLGWTPAGGANAVAGTCTTFGNDTCMDGVWNPNNNTMDHRFMLPIISSCYHVPHFNPLPALGQVDPATGLPFPGQIQGAATVADTNWLAARITGNGSQCFNIIPGAIGYNYQANPGNAAYAQNGNVHPGTDQWMVLADADLNGIPGQNFWNPGASAENGWGWLASTNACLASVKDTWDFDNFCQPTFKTMYSFLNIDPVGNTNGNAMAPYDTDNKTTNIDGNKSRYDLLYVVSPPEINTTDMQNNNDKASPYIPYRTLAPVFCQSADPDSPASGDCDPSKMVNYQLVLRDVSEADNAPVDDPSGSRHFPLCVLQPTSP